MRLKRSDLRRMLKPMVREFVEEAIEELVTESYIKNTIEESVLKGDVISHVISEVFRGMNGNNMVMEQTPPRRRPARQHYEEPEYESPEDDPVLEKIRQLSENSELKQTLAQRRQSYDELDRQAQQSNQLREEVQSKKIDWSSVSNSIPPDSDTIGLREGGRMSLQDASPILNPLHGVQGEGIDLNVIKALSEKSLWSKNKLNKFLNMDRRYEHWEKAPLSQVAKSR